MTTWAPGARTTIDEGESDVFTIPFDLARPPHDPPPRSDPLLWSVASELAQSHYGSTEGRCMTCEPSNAGECDAHRLAVAGMIVAAAGPLIPTPNRRRRDNSALMLDELILFLGAKLPEDESVDTFDLGYRSACEDILDLLEIR
jgi:hypothetical protein